MIFNDCSKIRTFSALFAKKMRGVSLADLFASTEELKEINSYDKSIMEKVTLMETLTKEEKHTIYTMLDAFVGKKKLKDALKNVLHDVK